MFYLDLEEINEPAWGVGYLFGREEMNERCYSLVINRLVKINVLPFDEELISKKYKKRKKRMQLFLNVFRVIWFVVSTLCATVL